LLTWAFADGGNHIGASGVVFCYFGALLGAAGFERRAATFAPALVTVMLYATMLVGLVPQQFISWEGHLAGFVVGVAASKLLAAPRRQRDLAAEEAEVDQIFGGAEPWFETPREN
jgi:membrane associated rhomboid family serine protease